MNSTPFNPKAHLITIKTKQGDQPYLPVAWRLVWFRSACPDGTITTEMVHFDPNRDTEEEAWVWNDERKRKERVVRHAPGFVVFKATVQDGKGGAATAYKSEKAASFPDFIEKCETGAVGRALAMLGYAPQYTNEFDERIDDYTLPPQGDRRR